MGCSASGRGAGVDWRGGGELGGGGSNEDGGGGGDGSPLLNGSSAPDGSRGSSAPGSNGRGSRPSGSCGEGGLSSMNPPRASRHVERSGLEGANAATATLEPAWARCETCQGEVH